jgi:maltose alpha-D-glucosyltransferase/alpha-amylase
MEKTFIGLWKSLYGEGEIASTTLQQVLWEIRQAKHSTTSSSISDGKRKSLPSQKFQYNQPQWYQQAVVYALYVQHFNKNFQGIIDRLDYLHKLGTTCLWLLPVLESPMRDEGFDVSDFYAIRPDLFDPGISIHQHSDQFKNFLTQAHSKGIRVIFDIALNHISKDHGWFQKALEDPSSPEFGYFHWSDTGKEHNKARIIFKGMLDSNWEWEPRVGKYYFHRFYPHQPDLNYGNPQLLQEIIRVLAYWISQGVDGFRVDAAPYFWKDNETNSENHPKTHSIIKILRLAVEAIKSDTLLLAEACQPPMEVVDYFGQGDECHGAYHFPLMPQIFKALATEDPKPIEQVLDHSVTPKTPSGSQWFTFLRCHDELTLEMVSPEDRQLLYTHYCKQPSWDFRQGEGISSRLIELVDSPQDALFAHGILLTLSGTPVIYYGDEVLTPNNVDFHQTWEARTGYTDSRNLVRGPLDWQKIEEQLQDPTSIETWHYTLLSQLIHIRNSFPDFGSSEQTIESISESVMVISKSLSNGKFQGWFNLSKTQLVTIPEHVSGRVLFSLGYEAPTIAPRSFVWLLS